MLDRAESGHFLAVADVNGEPIRFVDAPVVDTYLCRALRSDPEAKVRLEAVNALEYRKLTASTLEVQRRALERDASTQVRRKALTNLGVDIKELQASALFVKGRHTFADGKPGHFHLQITASGLGALGTDSEAELFKKIPDIDGFDPFKAVSDSHVVITIRGIGEMEAQNSNSFVSL